LSIMLSIGLTFESTLDARAQAGLVGPNAVIQLAEALRASSGGNGAAERVFASAGFLRLLRAPPDALIDETIPARLFDALWREMPPDEASRIAGDAGRRTGAYVLANRIPLIARVILRALPPRFAAPLLLKAIKRNAWTFAGSGTCGVASGKSSMVTIVNNPLAMPGGAWHVGVFECLFRALVNDRTRVHHAACQIDGAPVCRFEIDCLAGSRGSNA
jgi:divinyl protochlorophyllide a 8-vinyl-reductase